jgi:hypothetical protein
MHPSLATRGFDLRHALSPTETLDLLQRLPVVDSGSAGLRRLHELDWMRAFSTTSPMAGIAREMLSEDARVVRILFFEKQPGSNWKLPYHQDLTIAVKERAEVPGYGPWSVKDGIVHVQPPAEILERMVAVRLHLDDCRASNGALRVLAGSHLFGKLSATEVDEWVGRGGEEVVEAAAGDCVLMRPLLLHASSPATSPSHRRVLHIEYCNSPLPASLEWFLGWL